MNTAGNPQPSEKEAVRALRLGQRRVALKIYQSLLSNPDCNQAHLHLHISSIYGLLAMPIEQDRHVQLAAQIAPEDPSVLLDYGSFLFRAGKMAEARAYFERVVGDPRLESQAYGNLAAIEITKENIDKANELLDHSLVLDPNNSHAIDLRLHLLAAQLRLPEVRDSLIVSLSATNISLLRTLIGRQLDAHDEILLALEYFELAINADPRHIAAQLERVKILCRIGRSDEAIEQLLISLAIEPDHIEMLLAMASSLAQINQIESALYFCRRILEIELIHADASILLGCCYRLVGLDHEAVNVFAEALVHYPDSKVIMVNYAAALRNVNRIDESLHLSRRILAENPLYADCFYNLMFAMSTLPYLPPRDILALADDFWRRSRDHLIAEEPAWANLDNNLNKKYSKLTPYSVRRRIKIGFLSSEIGSHVVGQFLRSFLENYKHSLFHVTLIVSRRRYEDVEKELIELADDILDLQGLTGLAAALNIKSLELDIIVETSGYTANTQLGILCFRLAPVQCHYIGYHATTGLDTIDYFIGDSTIIPANSEHLFSETIWRMREPWIVISHHEEPPSAFSGDQISGPVFASFNQSAKFNEDTFSYWAAVLSAVPESTLLIKDRTLALEHREAWFSNSLEAQGIDKSRIRLMPPTSSWQEHMKVYNFVDVSLDCTHWSGSTTVFDSLVMGTPYIAIEGTIMSARMSSSILKGYGYRDWIAKSRKEYGEIARTLTNNLNSLRSSKAGLQKKHLKMTKRMASEAVRQLEDAFTMMVGQ